MQQVSANECILAGKWAPEIEKSNTSILKSKILTKEQKTRLVAAGPTLSNVIIVNTCHDFTIFQNGTKETTKLINVKTDGNIVIAEYYHKAEKRVVSTKSVLLGDCYYVDVTEHDFKDYYCKSK